METTRRSKKQPNHLMRGLVIISIAVHFVIFLHISGLYNSAALQFIELTMEDMSKSLRAIPRPTHRPKPPDLPPDVQKIKVRTNRIQPVKPIKVDPPSGNFSEGLMEGISSPEIGGEAGDMAGTYKIEDLLNIGAEYTTKKSYLEMVVLKIESVKEYPESAKSTQKQGRVTVGFVVTMAGEVKDVQVVEGCRYEILNQAAVKAVKDAAPFPRPPLRFFNKDIPLKLNIIFETT